MSGWVDPRGLVPGLRGQRVHVVAAAEEARLRSILSAAGFDLITLAGTAIANESTLFAEMARAFGLAEDFGGNWDALADALGDLDRRPSPRLAVVWVHADVSIAADLQTFLSAVLALDQAASDLATTEDGGAARQLEVFLLGAGSGFPDPA
jgi:RNAse (barnase) inhibitor barstar